MYELFFQNLAKHIQVDSFDQQQIEAKLQLKSAGKNEKVLTVGDYSRDLYFVNSGCLRIFQSHSDGEETNVLFCPEEWWACDILSFSNDKPATYSIEALENSELVSINAKDLELLYYQVPKLERFFRILFQNAFALYQRRLSIALSTSADVRYELFSKQYPTLINRVSQKQIASYLGITPVFLSMIRKKLSQ